LIEKAGTGSTFLTFEAMEVEWFIYAQMILKSQAGIGSAFLTF